MYYPQLITPVVFRYTEIKRGQGLCELTQYETMGDPHYDFGAAGQSQLRTRLAIQDGEPFSIVRLTCLPADFRDDQPHSAFRQGDVLYALLKTDTLDRMGGPAGISWSMQQVFDGKLELRKSMRESGHYCMWHDLQHDIYFAPNSAFLKLVHSIMGRLPGYSMEIDDELHIGDQLRIATIINGRSCKSIFGMNVRQGPVTSLLPNQVTVNANNVKYRMPYAYILTSDISVSNEEQP